MRFRFKKNYRSSYGIGVAGDIVELEPETAEAINRDSPGTLEPAADEPAGVDSESNRQIFSPRGRRSRVEG